MSIPKGGLPQGYSYMQGTVAAPGPRQACLHENYSISYYMEHGPLDGYVISKYENRSWTANPGQQGRTLTPEQAMQLRAAWRLDPKAQRFIRFSDAIGYIKREEILEWYKNQATSKLYKMGAEGLDESSRIALAALSAIEEAMDLKAYSQNRRNTEARSAEKKLLFNSTIIYGGPDYVTPEGMTSQVMAFVQRFGDVGPLPEDHDGHPTLGGKVVDPYQFLGEDKGRVPLDSNNTPTDDPSVPATRTIYFYRFDHAAVNSVGEVTDAFAFCNYGFAIMVRDTSMNWHFYKAGAGNTGFFRRSLFGDSFTDVFGVSEFLEDEGAAILDGIITIVELVVDAYTGGATGPIFAAINPVLFGAIKAALSGDTSDIFAAVGQTVEYLLKEAGPIATHELWRRAPKTASFLLGTTKDQPGVGTTLFNVYSSVTNQIAKANGFLDKGLNTAVSQLLKADATRALGQAALLSIDAVGHGAIHTAFDMASDVSKGLFPAVTKDVASTVQATLGGPGTLGDHFFTIGNDYVSNRLELVVAKIQGITDPNKYVAQAKKEISAIVDQAMQLHVVPDYAKNALYLGAMIATAAAVQGNIFIPDPTIRRWDKQTVTELRPGYVPPELKRAVLASNDLASKVFVLGSVLSLASPKERAIVAANANVLLSQVGPSFASGAVIGGGVGTLAWLGKEAMAKALGKPAWAPYLVAGAAALAAGVTLYLTRFNVHGKPITGKEHPPLPAQPNFVTAAMTAKAFAERHATSASLTVDYSLPGKASLAPSTTSLIELGEITHVFTAREVQYLLNLWGSKPLPQVTGNWDDTTVRAVRDYQTRESGHYGLMDVTGDPFDSRTSYSLHMFAKERVSAGKLGQDRVTIGILDAQTLLDVPNTGVMDIATQAKLNQYAALLSPSSPPGTRLSLADPRVQVYLTGMAKTRASAGGGFF